MTFGIGFVHIAIEWMQINKFHAQAMESNKTYLIQLEWPKYTNKKLQHVFNSTSTTARTLVLDDLNAE